MLLLRYDFLGRVGLLKKGRIICMEWQDFFYGWSELLNWKNKEGLNSDLIIKKLLNPGIFTGAGNLGRGKRSHASDRSGEATRVAATQQRY